MKKHILCFGDSNTHGYCADPDDCLGGGIRFTEEQRWTRLLQKALGEDYLVIEEGLSGRTTCFDDPIHEGLNALDYIYPCLKSHEAIDLLIIMLGTNDTGMSVDEFISSYTALVQAIQESYPYTDIIVNTVPPVPANHANYPNMD